MLIEGNDVHDNGSIANNDPNQDHGIYLEGNDKIVRNNTFREHGFGFGVQMYDNGNNNRVLNNIIDHSGGFGRNCCGGLVVGGGSGGTYTNVEIAGNIITRSFGADIDNDRLDGDCQGDIHDNNVEKLIPAGEFPAGCAINNF
jgi:hypothetical protein